LTDFSVWGDVTIRRSGKRTIAADFPYQVVVSVPAVGLGALVADMYGFCHARALPYRIKTQPRQEAVASDYAIWCFANLKDADLFHRQFGGERVTITVTRPVPKRL